jgi:lipid-binding SYLF domain-containing protein
MVISIRKSSKISRALCLFSAITLLLTVGLLDSALAVTADEIDKRADEALKRLYELEGGKEFADKAKGLLIMPKVGKGALIVGFEHGKGALRVDGKTVDYYSLSAGSLGLQIGGEAKAIIIAFMTKESLVKFRASKNWEAGVDANIAMIKAGDGGSLSNITGKEPIQAIVFGVKGLLLDLSLKGAKFSKLDESKLDKKE